MSVVWLAFVVLGVVAAATDLATYRIPNWGSAALCILFAAVAFLHGAKAGWIEHLGAGAVCLAAGILFFAAKQMGAGDAKLLAAVSLFAGFTALIPLLFWTAIAALFELGVILGLRRIVPALQSRIPKLEGVHVPRVLAKRQGVPLGAGIALGSIIASHWFPSWLWAA